MAAHRRHDISDRVWALLEPHLPGRSGIWWARDNRLFIDSVSGSCVRARTVARFTPLTMAAGVTSIVVLFDGVTKEYGEK